MFGIDTRAARYTWTAALVLLLVCCIYLIRDSLILFAVALLLTYLLYPLFSMLNRILPGRSRGPALALVYVILFGILTLLVVNIGSRVVDEANSLATRFPSFLNQLQHKTDQAAVPDTAKSIEDDIINQVRQTVFQHSGELMSMIPQYSLKLLSGSRYLLLALVVPIISFFMLKDGSQIREDLIDVFAFGKNRPLVEDVLSDVHVLLLQYMRALFTLCLAVFASFSLVFTLMGVPDALLLASIAFPLEFIPLVGPLMAAVVIMIVVLFDYGHPWWVLLFLGCYRLFQDYVLSPNLMSAGVELHPLLVIFGVFAGAEIGGVAGVFLSIPVLALVRIVIRRIRKQRVIEPQHVEVS